MSRDVSNPLNKRRYVKVPHDLVTRLLEMVSISLTSNKRFQNFAQVVDPTSIVHMVSKTERSGGASH